MSWMLSLTPTLEKFVENKVKSGRYQNDSEVIREALRLLERRDEVESAKFAALKLAIDKGLESAKHGDLHDFDVDDFINQMKASRATADG